MLRFVQRINERKWFPRPEGMPEAMHLLLIQRGIGSQEEARAFLNPGPDSLHDPLLLNDMGIACEKVRRAVEEHAPICVYGDYDVDGVCASSILCLYLKSLGADVREYLPSRHTEGYGLNEAAIREIAGWAKLMVTVDCGVTSVDLVNLAKELGLDVVVTDHHRPAEQLPNCPVVNPLLNDYPFPALCGAGVAWKMVCALGGLEAAMAYVDIAALATVADVVSLTGENRAIVRMGLDSMNRRPRPGLDALIHTAGLSEKKITSTMLAFQLAPRLNAGGRIGSAVRSFRLVTADSAASALALADELEQENTRRRQIEQQILSEAEAMLSGFNFANHRILILSGKEWNAGVIGLTASRLVEKYHYPVIMLSDQGDHMTGSCRSIDGVDIHAALCACGEYLVRFGGHKQAAGLTILPENLDVFRRAMDAWLFENIPAETYIPVHSYDMEISFPEITQGFIASLEGLQPTGFGNPAPVFRATAQILEARAVGTEGAHLKLMLSQDSRRINGIAFREGHRAADLAGETDVLFTPSINSYMGRSEVQLDVRALADSDVFARIGSKIEDEPALHCNFLTELLYNKKINRYNGKIETIDKEGIKNCLNESPQGVLILTTDFSAAMGIFRLEGINAPDLFIGEMPEDARAFNAVCVCPPAKEIPAGYRRIILCGMPDEFPLGEGRTVFSTGEKPAWMNLLPDIDAMRACWRAMISIFQRPLNYRTFSQLVHLVRAETDLPSQSAAASLMVMHDLELITLSLSGNPIQVFKNTKKKADPESSPIWQAIQRWRI